VSTDTALQVAAHDPLEGLVAGWLHENSASPKTLAAYTDTIARFGEALRSEGLGLGGVPGLVAAVAQRWARQRADGRGAGEAAKATQNQRLAILSSFYRYANRMMDAGDVPNPIAKVKRAKVQAYRGAQPLEASDVRRRLAEIDRRTLIGLRDYALLSLALETGRRASELRLLTWGDVTLHGDRASVAWPENKGKQMRDVLPSGATAALLAWLRACYDLADLAELPPEAPIAVNVTRNTTLRGRQMSRQALSDVWQHRLGTSRIHVTRHTFAHLMEQSGAKVSEIQQRLGHASLATTSVYLSALSSGENPYATVLESKLGISA
jgi:integrase